MNHTGSLVLGMAACALVASTLVAAAPWYSQIGGLGAPAETFMLDGKQHLLFSAGGGLYMFVLN